MKKIITLSILLFSFSLIINAQWVSVGNGMDNYVNGSAVYNGKLYACGNFEHADGNQCLGIAQWNGTSWSDVGGGFNHNAFTNVVYAMIVFNNQLIAGGYVDTAGGVPVHNIAAWNGTSWSPLGMNLPIGTVRCFAVHNGELYAGGSGGGAGNFGVAKWNGSTWTTIDSGSNNNIAIWALASYNGDLYAGGSFSSIDGITANHIAKWNGTSWSDVGGGTTNGFTNIVRALTVCNNKLYAGGSFTMAGSTAVNHIASWDGSNWADVGGGVGGSTAIVQSLLTSGNQLFVGGTFWDVNSVTANRAASWDGSNWTVYGTDLAAGARTQAVFNNELYSFGELSGSGQNYAAKWSGGTILGLNNLNSNSNVSIYPNPANDKLTINNQELKITEVKLVDVLGKTIYLQQCDRQATSISLDISSLNAGIYFLSANNTPLKTKIIVQR